MIRTGLLLAVWLAAWPGAAAERSRDFFQPVSEAWKPALERFLADPSIRAELPDAPLTANDAWSPAVAILEEASDPAALLAREDASAVFLSAVEQSREELAPYIRSLAKAAKSGRTNVEALPELSGLLLQAHARSWLLGSEDRALLLEGLDAARKRYWRKKGADLLASASADIPRAALFPDPRTADEDDLVTTHVPLTPETMLEAYRVGLFPWWDEGEKAGWYSPKKRGVLDLDELHVSKSLAKLYRQKKYQITIDRAFEAVLRACATVPRPDEEGTWISDRFIATYLELHRRGFAHSVEVWDGDRLVGGLYGVAAHGIFSGESMFHYVSNASKLALVALVDHLRSRGYRWIDTQMVTNILKEMGAKEMDRDAHLQRLPPARARSASF